MNWRLWWERLSGRERTLIGAAGAVLGLALVRFLLIGPFLSYREGLRDEITGHQELLQNDQAYLTHAAEVTKRLEELRARYRELRSQLVPGDTPTLAAASLQDTLHSLASEKNVNIQSTQVMREETIGEFRRIAVRITVTGELKPLAEFLYGVEFGQRRLSIPFLELSRRGAVLRGQSARALAGTIEVNAFLQGTDKDTGTVEAAAATAPAPANPEAGASPAGGAASAGEDVPGPAPGGASPAATPGAAAASPATRGPVTPGARKAPHARRPRDDVRVSHASAVRCEGRA